MEITIQIDEQVVSVEVTVEVYEYLDRADHKEENLAHEQRRHWDGREFDEYILLTEGHACYDMTPEQYVCLPQRNHVGDLRRPYALHREPTSPVPALCPGGYESCRDRAYLRLFKSVGF